MEDLLKNFCQEEIPTYYKITPESFKRIRQSLKNLINIEYKGDGLTLVENSNR